jgi:pimeloyl-ACP methyl ester carboxylesterase
VLDVFDDVRRHYRVDPDQTYVVGFAGSARVAISLAFALPECVGGVVAISGFGPMNDLPYLRHRVRDRLSVALVAGAGELARNDLENYDRPLLEAMDVRSRLWILARPGAAIPSAEALTEIHGWLAEDLPRRRADAKARPSLAVAPDEVPTPLQQASRLVDAAVADLPDPGRTWHAVALLEGVQARWPDNAAAARARKLLDEVRADPEKARLLGEQRSAEQRQTLVAQARAREQAGRRRQALETWQALIQGHAGSVEATKAAKEVTRLIEALATTSSQPFLGLALAGESATVSRVSPGGPAAAAGVQPGDVIRQLGAADVRSYQGLRSALRAHQAGDRVLLIVLRDAKTLTLNVTLATPPAGGQ